MNLKHSRYLIISLLIIIITSCKKEVNSDPQIVIISPTENQQFNVLDTIQVKCIVCDDNGIENIKTVLVNESLIPVLNPVNYYPQTENKNIDLEILYPLDDIHLESGKYFILVRAFDGTNFKNKYVSINLDEVPKELEKLIVLTKPDNFTTNVFSVNPVFEIEEMFVIDGNYISSDISSKYRQIYFTGDIPCKLFVFDLEENELDWSVDASMPYPVFSNVYYNDGTVYTSSENANITGYNNVGTVNLSTEFNTDSLPTKLLIHGEFILSDLKLRTGPQRLIATYYLVSGVKKQQIITNFKVIDFYLVDENNIIVFAVQNNTGKIFIYNVTENYISEPIHIFNDEIISTAITNKSNFLVGTNNTIWLFNSSNSSTTSVVEGITASQLEYDELNEVIFATELNNINFFQYPSGNLIKCVNTQDTILNIHLLYNK